MATRADILLDDAYKALGLEGSGPNDRYAAITQIVKYLGELNDAKPISVGTTGTITERLCTLALEEIKSTHPSFEYRRFGKDWAWIGDLLIPGHPYDLAVSVKSFKAKERLLASGTGSLLSPTVGWGLFDDHNEWSANRTHSYIYRGFLAIYMPANTLNSVSDDAKRITNINGRPLLRDLVEFPDDVKAAIPANKARVDVRKI